MAFSLIHSISAAISSLLRAVAAEEKDATECVVVEETRAAVTSTPADAEPHALADQSAKASPLQHSSSTKAAISHQPVSEPQPPLLTILSRRAELLDRTLVKIEVVAKARPSADALFGLAADPSKHTELFDAIESTKFEVVSDDGNTRIYNLDYMTRWTFWKFHGVAESKLVMTVVRQQRTVTFALREPGFLVKYEGGWAFMTEADGGARITIGFSMQPKTQPPYPLNLILKRQQLAQTESMLQSLAEAADKLPAAVVEDTAQESQQLEADVEEDDWVAVSAGAIPVLL